MVMVMRSRQVMVFGKLEIKKIEIGNLKGKIRITETFLINIFLHILGSGSEFFVRALSVGVGKKFDMVLEFV